MPVLLVLQLLVQKASRRNEIDVIEKVEECSICGLLMVYN